MVNRGADPGLWAAKILFFTLFMGIFFSNTMKIMYVSMYIFQANSAVDNLENLFKEMKAKEIEFGSQREFLNKNIEFKNVDFSYDGENKILDKFSLSLEEDKVYALVGSSGSGDSDIMMTDTINPLKSKFKGFHKTFKQDDLGLSLSSFLLN